MTDSNDDKTLSVAGKKTLTLKPSGMSQGTVRQDMGRGRTKAVVVETRKRRPLRPAKGKRDEILPSDRITPAAGGRPPHFQLGTCGAGITRWRARELNNRAVAWIMNRLAKS